jgi:hypothetical protein
MKVFINNSENVIVNNSTGDKEPDYRYTLVIRQVLQKCIVDLPFKYWFPAYMPGICFFQDLGIFH